jgi:short-subunit dehydrogenase
MNSKLYTLITGASKGFGKAMAYDCASRNMNLILVSLPGEHLKELTIGIKAKYGVDVKAIETDLTQRNCCYQLYDEVKAMGLQVNMLINNAGIGCTEYFDIGKIDHYEEQIRLNVLATTVITHLFIDMLKKNSPSYILNVGSLASFFLLAKKQVYGATKSYICYFSKSLRRELKEDKVYVSIVCPGAMYTNDLVVATLKTGNYLSRTSGMRPEDVAPIAINGLLRNKEIIIPGKINSTIYFLNTFLPRFIVNFFEIRTMKRIHTPCIIKQKQKATSITIYKFRDFRSEPVV